MGRFLLARTARLVLVLWGVLTLAFLLLRLSGDPTTLFVAQDATQAQVEQVRHQLGFDQPLIVQYAWFLGRLAHGDFDRSLRFDQPAITLVWAALPYTLELSLVALAIAMLLGIPGGAVAALRPGSVIDFVATLLALVGQSIPVFWLGILLILLFSVQLRWLPVSGSDTPAHLVLPAVTLGAFFAARFAQLTRSGLVEVLTEDYVRTAHAKGLRARTVLMRHALRNVAIAQVTVAALTFSALLGGAIVTETIFAWPGMGRLLLDAVNSRDYPLVQASVFVIALFVSLANLLADISYGVLDPRVGRG
ncbi:MAG: ABC transporter permease [Chloroflexi bacterium]|nr:ABC transporter permease [Chloroflexota bacterium]